MVKLVVTDKDGRTVEVDAQPGLSIMENIRALPRSVEAICGGMCACATCHVYVDPAWLDRVPPRSYEELVMLRDLATFDPERSRLSCQIVASEPIDGLPLTVAPDADCRFAPSAVRVRFCAHRLRDRGAHAHHYGAQRAPCARAI